MLRDFNNAPWRLISRCGIDGVYDGLGAFLDAFLGGYPDKITLRFERFGAYLGEPITRVSIAGDVYETNADFALFDPDGLPVGPTFLVEAARLRSNRWTLDWAGYWALGGSGHYRFRDGPVGWTGRRRRGRGSIMRRIRTTAERRAYAAAADDDGVAVPIRGRRRPHGLPTAWDDILRHTERSWKRHRKTQWRPTGEQRRRSAGKAEKRDATVAAFLDFLARDMAAHPEHVAPLPADLIEKAIEVAAIVSVDLDEVIAGDVAI